jgi:NAD(P)-dependent dehydrogenase (short-subunit alcohol dehydrogenase family)
MTYFLITGATHGIGKKCAEEILKEGYHVILLARNQKLVEKTIDEFKSKNPDAKVTYHLCDFTDFKSVKLAAEEIQKSYPRLDYIFLNAGALPPHKGAKTKFGHDFSMSTNFVGPDILLRLLLPMVEKSDIRVVLHTTSLSAFRKFEPKQINEIHTYGRIKSYATSKLFAATSMYYYASKHPRVRFKLMDPGIVYSNIIYLFFPKFLRFLSPIAHLITRMPIVVAREVLKAIKEDSMDPIIIYKGGKVKKPHPSFLRSDLQDFTQNYAKELRGDLL